MHRSAHGTVPPQRAATEARYLVVRVGDNLCAAGEAAHVEPMQVVGPLGLERRPLLACHIGHALQDQLLRLRVQGECHAKRARRALSGMVVRRCADAATGKNHITRSESARQRRCDAPRRIAHIVGVRQLQAARVQPLNDGRQMLVGALARHDLVADDDQAKVVRRGGARRGRERVGNVHAAMLPRRQARTPGQSQAPTAWRSSRLSQRHWPGARSCGSSSAPMRERCRRSTRLPTAASMRLTWWYLPSVSVRLS